MHMSTVLFAISARVCLQLLLKIFGLIAEQIYLILWAIYVAYTSLFLVAGVELQCAIPAMIVII